VVNWLVDAVGTTISILILFAILTVAGLGALMVYGVLVASGEMAQWEEDNYGWRRS